MDGSSAAESLSSLGKSITSPAKLGFAGYVLLAYAGKIGTSVWQFIFVALAFLFLQAFHDDFLRIVLNNWANGRGKR